MKLNEPLRQITRAKKKHAADLSNAIAANDLDTAAKEARLIQDLDGAMRALNRSAGSIWTRSVSLLFVSLAIVCVLSLCRVNTFDVYARMDSHHVSMKMAEDYAWTGNQTLDSSQMTWRDVCSLTCPTLLEAEGKPVSFIAVRSKSPTLRYFLAPKGSWITLDEISTNFGSMLLSGGHQKVILDVADSTELMVGGGEEELSSKVSVALEVPEEIVLEGNPERTTEWELRFPEGSDWKLYNLQARGILVETSVPMGGLERTKVSTLESAQLHLESTGEVITLGPSEFIDFSNPEGTVLFANASKGGISVAFQGHVKSVTIGKGNHARKIKPSLLAVLSHRLPKTVLLTSVLSIWALSLRLRDQRSF